MGELKQPMPSIMNKCFGLLVVGLLAISYSARYAEAKPVAEGEAIQGPTLLVRPGDIDFGCEGKPGVTDVEEIDCLCECYRRGFGWFWFYHYGGASNYCSCGGQFINGSANPGAI